MPVERPDREPPEEPETRPDAMANVVGEPGRLDAVLARLTGLPRAEIQRAIDEGRVTVDGTHRDRSFRLGGGESITVVPRPEGGLEPEGPPLVIRYEDDALAVVVKPGGLVTHPTERRRTGTLVNRLLGMDVPLAARGGPLRPGVVHRLDAGTSGLLLVAKTDEAHAELEAMMRRHGADRRYLALVRGAVEQTSFTIDAPLGRRAARIVVDRAEGRRAETTVEVREPLARATLLEAAPRTGRTHQIRVHMAAIGHPILGDRAYGGAGEEAARIGLTRPFLHAWRLAFTHPFTHEPVEVEEPLPSDLDDALARARRDQRP